MAVLRRAPVTEMLSVVLGSAALVWAGSRAGLPWPLYPVALLVAVLSWRVLPARLRPFAAPAWAGFGALFPFPFGDPIQPGERLSAVVTALVSVAAATAAGWLFYRPPLLRQRRTTWVLALLAPLAAMALLLPSRVVFLDQGAVAGGYAIPGFRFAVAIVLVVSSALALGAARHPAPLRARRLLLWLGLPLLALGVGFRYRVHTRPLDPLGEGAPLAITQAFEGGRQPYRDLALAQGVGPELIQPLVAFRVFGKSLRGLRALEDLLAPVDTAIVVLAGASILPFRWALLFAAGVLTGALPAARGSEFLLADLALLLLLRGVGRSRSLLAGSVVAIAALLWSPASGAPVAAAALVLLLMGSERGRLAAALAAVALLAAFLPLPAWAPQSGSLTLLSGALVGIAGTWGGRRRRASAAVIALVTAAALAPESGPSLALLLLFPLGISSLTVEAPLAALSLALLLVPGSGVATIGSLVQDLRTRHIVDISGRSLIDRGRLGILLPLEQARRISAVTAVLDRLPPGQDYFDFSNHPLLHFLTERAMPTRFAAIAHAQSDADERAIVSALAASPPRLVLFRANNEFDRSDGLDNRARYPRVSAWLVRHYRPLASAGGYLLLVRGEQVLASMPEGSVHDRLDFGALPLAWAKVARSGTALPIQTSGDGVHSLELEDSERADLDAILFVLEASSAGAATLSWHTAGVAQDAGIAFELRNGRHRYLVPVAAHPAWVWPDSVDGITLRVEGAAVTALAAELLHGPPGATESR